MYWVESHHFVGHLVFDLSPLVVVIKVAKETKPFLSTTYFSYTRYGFSSPTCGLSLKQNSVFNFILISDIHISQTCKAYLNHK